MTPSARTAAFAYTFLVASVVVSACTYEPVGVKPPAVDSASALPSHDAGSTTGSPDPLDAGAGAGSESLDVGGGGAVPGDTAPGDTAPRDATPAEAGSGDPGPAPVDGAIGACGNGMREGNETCDPVGTCPTSCPNRGCMLFKLEGHASDCTAVCTEAGKQTACATGDGCCPAGCNSNNDKDCDAVCDNGVKEGSETCDPLSSCPNSCPAMGCQLRKLTNPGSCLAKCVNDRKQTACLSGDGCCPAGCNANNDKDCDPVCDNGVKEGSETCDPLSSCPSSCPAMGCQLRKLVGGGSCKAVCQNAGTQATCATGDGCCPAGCNNTNDAECAPACGNGVVERGESCEPVAECNRRAAACQSDQNTVRTGSGSAAACTFQCAESPRPCGPGDGVCPAGCGADPDCLPRPTSCTHIEYCHKPSAPDQNQLICRTNDDARCTDGERIAECAREANSVCGTGHARPIQYRPPIAGMSSGG